MGPVITAESKNRIENQIQLGLENGTEVLVDGRQPKIERFEKGYFIRPTILEKVSPDSDIAHTEIFGPVLSMIHVETIEDAIELVNSSRFGNMACLLLVMVLPLDNFVIKPM